MYLCKQKIPTIYIHTICEYVVGVNIYMYIISEYRVQKCNAYDIGQKTIPLKKEAQRESNIRIIMKYLFSSLTRALNNKHIF